MIRDLLAREFEQVSSLGDPERIVEVFDRDSPDILVLAFPAVKSAERYYLGLLRRSRRVRERPHRTVVLCERDEVRQAYYLCRRQHFDDYVVFWPLSYDPHRLWMAVHHAAQAIAAALKHGAHTGVFALRAHDLANPGDPVPPAEPAAGAGDAAASPAAPGEAPPASTVLLVDDDPFQHTLIRGALVDTEFRLECVATPGEVFDHLRNSAPDVILMDFELPEMNGVEILRRLRRSRRWRDVPVVIVTGHSTREVAIRSLEAGAADFIVKPCEREALLRKLRAAISPRAAAATRPL